MANRPTLHGIRSYYLYGVIILLTIKDGSSKRVKYLDSVCSLPMDEGFECTGNFHQTPTDIFYYFNVREKACLELNYKGCGGNRNRFQDSQDCIDACETKWLIEYNKSLKSSPEKAKVDCKLEPDPGPCKALIPMWTYDAHRKQCTRFSYGGCGGNSNKFDTKGNCLKACF